MQREAAWDATVLGAIIDQHRALEGPLLPILHAVRAAFGHVPRAALPLIAEALNLSRAEVYGVVTFYADFRFEPARAPVLRLCGAEACQAMGGAALAAQARRDAAERVEVETVYCLGLCATAPAAMLNGEPHGRLDAAALEALLAHAGR